MERTRGGEGRRVLPEGPWPDTCLRLQLRLGAGSHGALPRLLPCPALPRGPLGRLRLHPQTHSLILTQSQTPSQLQASAQPRSHPAPISVPAVWQPQPYPVCHQTPAPVPTRATLDPAPSPALHTEPLAQALPLPQLLGDLKARGPDLLVNSHVLRARPQDGHWDPELRQPPAPGAPRPRAETSARCRSRSESPFSSPARLPSRSAAALTSTRPGSCCLPPSPSINNCSGPTDHSPTKGPASARRGTL